MIQKTCWFAAGSLAFLAACGPGGGKGDGGASANCGLSACDLASARNTAPLSTNGDGGAFTCGFDGLTPYAPCVSEGDGTLRVTFLCADPDPPAVGTNRWTVAVTDGAGKPQPGLALSLSLWMPQHCHGTGTPPSIADNGDGTYTISNVYLFMPGVWQATFSLDGGYAPGCPPADSAAQQFSFPVGC